MKRNKQKNTELCKKHLVDLIGKEKVEKIKFNPAEYGSSLYIDDINLFHELSQKIENNILFHYHFGLRYFLMAPKENEGDLYNNNWIVDLPQKRYDEFIESYGKNYEINKQF